jgi:hypothetical protein
MISGKRHQDVHVKMDTLDAAHLTVKYFDVAISLFEAGAQYPWLLVLDVLYFRVISGHVIGDDAKAWPYTRRVTQLLLIHLYEARLDNGHVDLFTCLPLCLHGLAASIRQQQSKQYLHYRTRFEAYKPKLTRNCAKASNLTKAQFGKEADDHCIW